MRSVGVGFCMIIPEDCPQCGLRWPKAGGRKGHPVASRPVCAAPSRSPASLPIVVSDQNSESGTTQRVPRCATGSLRCDRLTTFITYPPAGRLESPILRIATHQGRAPRGNRLLTSVPRTASTDGSGRAYAAASPCSGFGLVDNLSIHAIAVAGKCQFPKE